MLETLIKQLIMVQLDLEKAYDHVNWSFVSGLMHTMGFGPRMSRLIFLLGQDAVSRVMLNGGVTSDIALAFVKDALLVRYCL